MSRIERINAEMKKQLSSIIPSELKDPRIEGLISIIKVDVDEDLKTMKVYLSVLGANGREKEVLKEFAQEKGGSQSFARPRIHTRRFYRVRN